MKTALYVLPLLMVVVAISTSVQAIQSPILFFPGITNSALNVTNTRNSLCNTQGSSRRLWTDVFRLILCGRQELGLQYNEALGRFQDLPGVSIEVEGFGGTQDVEYMGLGNTVPYLVNFVEYFVERGFVREKTIRTAPYDWRLAADELDLRGYYENVKGLIETMYTENGGQRVTLVAHSMGSPVSLHFLTGYPSIDQAWKDKYINAYVSLSGAWSGGVQTLARAISGLEFEDPLLSLLANRLLVPILRSFQSIPWLLPRASLFGDTILVSTPSRDYTVADYEELFDTIGYSNGFETFQNLVDTLNPGFPAPNVPTHCYYGVNVSTPETYLYDVDFSEINPIGIQPVMILTGDGDGTVNQVSSEVCQRWADMSYPFTVREYDGVNHGAMVNDDGVLGDLALIVGASPPGSRLREDL